jgi:5'-3' exonuclease
MKGLLDGDIIVFRCGFAAERNIWFLAWKPDDSAEFQEHKSFDYKRDAMEHLDRVCPGKYSRVEGEDYKVWSERELEPLSHALHGVKRSINAICKANDLNPDTDLIVYLSPGGPTFRHEIAVTRPYKGNRKAEHRPTYEKEIRQYMIETYVTVVAENEEADDLLAIEQTKLGPHDSIILSIDKDLDQVPGLKYNFMHEVGYDITPEAADKNFCMQLLTGDTTDNIPGLPKVGPATATKILHGLTTYDEMMEEIDNQYAIRSGHEDYWAFLIEQGRLLWIRREPGQMWEPPEKTSDPFTEMSEEELTL